MALNMVRTYSVVAVEALNVRGMVQSHFGKSITDAGWSSFIAFMEYKADSFGSAVVRAEAKGTSQTCPECGNIVKKELSERWHSCECGYEAPRDVASARVILQRGEALRELALAA